MAAENKAEKPYNAVEERYEKLCYQWIILYKVLKHHLSETSFLCILNVHIRVKCMNKSKDFSFNPIELCLEYFQRPAPPLPLLTIGPLNNEFLEILTIDPFE